MSFNLARFLAYFLLVSGLLASAGVAWFDMGATSEWEQKMAGATHIILAAILLSWRTD